MAPFIYRALDQTTQEIRLVDILPSTDSSAPIKLIISHAAFVPPPDEVFKDRRAPLEEIQKTLLPDWYVDKTREGRFLYEDEIGATTWVHPGGLDFGDPPPCPPAGFEPHYEALSYAWGDLRDTEAVSVWLDQKSDGPQQGSLQVTYPLAVALRHLRQSDKPRRMWIDAICINQQDHAERSRQVLRMRDIFRLAIRVIVWLGLADNHSNLAIRVLRTIGQRAQWGARIFKPCPDHLVSPQDFEDPTYGTPWNVWVEEAIYHLGARSWFSRVWTVQEFQLGNKDCVVQCGNASISRRCFRMACTRLMDRSFWFHNHDFQNRLARMVQSIADMSLDPWGRILGRASEKYCTDSRDKIYGTLGLLRQSILDIQPDYTAPVAEIYKTAMLQHVKAVGRLALLDHCYIGTKLRGSPSWVPNWEVGSDGMFMSHNGWSASGFSSSSWTQPDANTLCVEGVRLGAVTAISPLLPTEKAFVDFVRGAVYGHNNDPWIPKCTYDYLQQFVYLFNGGYIREHYPAHDYLPSWRECRAHLWDHIEQIPDVHYPKSSPVKSRALRMPPPRLFYGSDGRIGSGPADTEPGDVLAVFPGCPLPKILRPTENSAYEIVGSYKVCGLTHAEAFLGRVSETHYPVFGVDNCKLEQAMILDLETDESREMIDDPRLEKLSVDWVVRPLSVEGGERNDGMPLFEFTNTKTGEVRRTDPRMSIEALRARGVPFETFTLV